VDDDLGIPMKRARVVIVALRSMRGLRTNMLTIQSAIVLTEPTVGTHFRITIINAIAMGHLVLAEIQ
jgi:hypothetical protein